MRLRAIQNPNNGADQIAEYFDRTIYSTCVLSTSFQSYDFFQNVEAPTLRNYQNSSNFFLSQQGAVIALQMSLHGANYAAIKAITTSAYGDRLDAWNKLVQQGQLNVVLDTKPNAILLGSDLANSPPILIESSGAGVLNDVNPHYPFAQPNEVFTTVRLPRRASGMIRFSLWQTTGHCNILSRRLLQWIPLPSVASRSS